MKLRTQLALAACLSLTALAAPAFADDMGMAPGANSQMSPNATSGDAMSTGTTDKKKDETKKEDAMAPNSMAPNAMAPNSMGPETHDTMSAPDNAMKH